MGGERAPREHVDRNRARWDVEAKDFVAAGERGWAREEPTWGIWRVAESQLHVLPGDLAGNQHGLTFPLIHADAELVPCRDATFDLAISEYGACLWADPDRWLPEAARLLRPGGELIFLVNSSLLTLCVPAEDDSPATDRLLRSSFGMFRIEWPGEPGVEFHLSHGEWIQRLRSSGFEIEELIEVRPPETATTRYPFVTLEWSRRWPAEEIWRARRR